MPRISVIRTARAKKGYTQEDLANIMNVSPNSVRAWESGLHEPKAKYIINLSMVLDLSLDELMEEFKEE